MKDEFSKEIEILGAETFSAKVLDVQPFTSYRIYVSAFNLIGEGPANSNSILVTTSEICKCLILKIKILCLVRFLIKSNFSTWKTIECYVYL